MVLLASMVSSLFVLIKHVSAAGSTVISVEASPTSATTGGDVTLRFYATPSGASVNSVSVNVALNNLSYVSYNGAGSGFNGVAQVPGGATASNFSVIGAYQSFGGSSSKVLILTVTAKASSSAGTGTVTLSGAEAYDTAETTMATTSQNTSVPISAPITPPTGGGGGSTGGSGGGGSGGSGSSGSGGGGSSAGGSGGGGGSQQNVAIVPGTEVGPEVPGVELPEPDLIAAETSISTADAGTESLTDKIKEGGKIALVAALLLGLAGVAVIAKVLVTRIQHAGGISGKVSGAIVGSPDATPTQTTTPVQQPTTTITPTEQPPHDNGPTIITPQK